MYSGLGGSLLVLAAIVAALLIAALIALTRWIFRVNLILACLMKIAGFRDLGEVRDFKLAHFVRHWLSKEEARELRSPR